jgi:hypothetical protein
MAKLLIVGVGVASGLQMPCLISRSSSSRSAVQMASLYDFSETKLGGGEVSMADFKGKPTVIVNVASL